MLYRLVRPMIRKGTRNPQFVQRIPTDLKAQMVGMKLNMPIGDQTVPFSITPKTESIRVSLRTADPSLAKERQAAIAAYLEKVFSSLRENRPVPLTHRQIVALSGEIYRAWASDPDPRRSISFVQDENGKMVRDYSFDLEALEDGYKSAAAKLDALREAGDEETLEKMVGPIVDRLLLARGIAQVDPDSRSILLAEFIKALHQGLEAGSRKIGGDYSPDPNSERFPEWRESPPAVNHSGQSLTGLLEAWWREAEESGLSVSTHESYRKVINTFVDFLGHDDARRVSPGDIIAFKDHLLGTTNPKTGRRISAKTVKDSYLSGLKSIFNWAVTNQRLATNPASGITIKLGKKRKVRESWFTADEVRAILSASANVKKGVRENPKRFALKRWVPWLCAYTGARVGEIVQLRKQDLWQEDGVWIMTITPEAGQVKDKERRDIPLHPHLVDLGFIKFLESAPDGYLFMWSGEGRAAWRSAKNRLTDFVRSVVSDPNVQPNHGWRHTFKTIGSEAGIQDKVLDAICGHDPRTVGEGYGGVTIKAKAMAMERFPRFMLD